MIAARGLDARDSSCLVRLHQPGETSRGRQRRRPAQAHQRRRIGNEGAGQPPVDFVPAGRAEHELEQPRGQRKNVASAPEPLTHRRDHVGDRQCLRIRRNDGRDEYPASRLVDIRRGKASAESARLLLLRPGDPLLVLRRVLEWEGEPVVLDEITLPAALFRGLTRAKYEAYHGSMYGFFETQFGVRMLKAQERLSAIAADAATAAILGVAAGSPLLAVDRVTLTYGDRPVEVRRGLCATRAHHYFNEVF